MIVAGETSGELYGALLASALRKQKPDISIIGRRRGEDAAGRCRNHLLDIERIRLAEAISSVRTIKETFRKAVSALQSRRPEVLVLIDYP